MSTHLRILFITLFPKSVDSGSRITATLLRTALSSSSTHLNGTQQDRRAQSNFNMLAVAHKMFIKISSCLSHFTLLQEGGQHKASQLEN